MPSFFSVPRIYPEMPLMDEMRAELRALKKEAGGNSISKMKKADLERQIEVYRGMVAHSPAPARRAEKAPPASRREPEPAPKKRVAESEGLGGGKPRPVAKAPPRVSKVREEEEDATVSKHAPKPTKITKAAPARPAAKAAPAKASAKVPKKMTVPSPEPEDSGSEFE